MKKQFVIINKGKGVLNINPSNLNKVEQPITAVDALYEYVDTKDDEVLATANTYTDNSISIVNNTINEIDDRLINLEYPDAILIRGSITLNNTTVKIPAYSFLIRINQREITNPTAYSGLINPATDGYNRIDIITINELGYFTKVTGVESLSIAVKPQPLPNTLEITSINIKGSIIAAPIVTDNSKLDKGGYNGTAKDLDTEIQNLKNPNVVLKNVTPTIAGLNISAPADSFEWRINQVVFDNTPALAKTLTAASDGFYRKDVLLGTNTNTYLIIKGVEGDESVTPPTVFPLGTILLGVIDVFGNTVGGFSINDTSRTYVYGNGGATDYVEVTKLGTTLEIRNATSITGFTIPAKNIQYGKDYYLRNSTGGLLTLKSATGTNGIRFYFPEGDLVVPVNNNVHLKYLSNAEFGGLGYFTLVGIDYNGKEDKSNKGVANGYVPLNEVIKIANEYLNIVNDLVTGGATNLLSAQQGVALQLQITAINTILSSDDINLDTIQELVDAIKTVETSLETILVNDLTTGGTTKALTAEMGKTLKELIDGLVVPTATDTVRGIVKTDIPVADPVVYVKETVDTLLEGKANYFLAIKPITGISYNVVIDDILNELVYEGTLPMNVIIPNNATVPFPIGTIFYTLGTNTGIVTASGASGVVLKIKSGISLSAIQNEVRQYTKIAINTWSVRGDLNLGAVTQIELSYLQGATSNIQAQINAKVTLNGKPNYLMKFLTSATATISRLFDNGTYLGIGTYVEPTKDITLGNQANRTIGVEDSENIYDGRDLEISSGRAVNFVLNSNFNLVFAGSFEGSTVICSPNGNVFAVNTNPALIYKQTNGIGSFISTGLSSRNFKSGCATVTNDVYFANYGGDIYKLTGGTGSLVPLGQTSRNWMGMCAVGSDIYAAVKGGDVYKMTGGTGNFIALGVTSRNWTSLAVSNTGDIYGCTDGPIYKRVGGAGDFILHSTVIAYSITITANNDLYTGSYQQGSYKQIGLTGAFVSTVSLGATWALSSLPNLNVYAVLSNGIYMQTNFAEGSPNLNGGTLKLVASGGKGGGTSRLEFFTGQKTGVATNMQAKILREYIDENGYHIYTSIPVHEDNAAALTAGLPIGCEYRTSTGIKMIVY